jgi:hypothetical protein
MCPRVVASGSKSPLQTMSITGEQIGNDFYPPARKFDLTPFLVARNSHLPPPDSLDLLDGDLVKLGDLSWRHTVICQGLDATELRLWYLGHRHPLLDNRACRFWRRFGARFDHPGVRSCHRLDRYDARPSRRLFLGCYRRIGRRGYPRYRCNVWCNVSLWPEKVLRGLTRSVDPFAIAWTARCMPVN